MTKVFRILLTLGLIVGVYFETGIFTAIFAFLISVVVEFVISFLTVYVIKNKININDLFKK